MRRFRRFGLFLGAVCLISAGCEPHKSWLRPQDEDELPPRGSGLKGTSSDGSIIGSNSGDQTTPTSFFKTDRRTGGWSSEAQEIARNLGAY
ncbi:MAG: hypothetical protein ACLQGP_19845 [Isosphaeraceae bacterium]